MLGGSASPPPPCQGKRHETGDGDRGEEGGARGHLRGRLHYSHRPLGPFHVLRGEGGAEVAPGGLGSLWR